MKKFIIILLLLFLFVAVAYASKQVILTQMVDVGFKGILNYYNVADNKYYYALWCFVGDAKDVADTAYYNVEDKCIVFGSGRVTPYTPNEIYTKFKNVLGQSIADRLKDLYLDGIDEDISQ